MNFCSVLPFCLVIAMEARRGGLEDSWGFRMSGRVKLLQVESSRAATATDFEIS